MADTNTNDDKKPVAKAVAQNAPDATPKVAGSNGQVKAVVAVNRINGEILPGTPFRPADAQMLADLEALGAVRDLTDAEVALFEKIEGAPSSNDSLLG